ncbi:ribonuclease P protein component 1 [Halobacterium wangiae]|uniref:ribonuclease P protein component 1 n=1 Tax=Halobacterium wangiae TaxID=2902623 RepID=UPI001E5D2B76|nr:ribonuclease P protein component 1 [Halobacterium wangiae]
MTVTPETLPRHELVGLHVRVAESTDPSRVGIEGRVVRETMRTLVIDTGSNSGDSDAGVKQVPKRGARFTFRLTDEAAVAAKATGTASKPAGGESQTTGEGVAYVTVDGVALLSRPALRSETGVDSKWR